MSALQHNAIKSLHHVNFLLVIMLVYTFFCQNSLGILRCGKSVVSDLRYWGRPGVQDGEFHIQLLYAWNEVISFLTVPEHDIEQLSISTLS